MAPTHADTAGLVAIGNRNSPRRFGGLDGRSLCETSSFHVAVDRRSAWLAWRERLLGSPTWRAVDVRKVRLILDRIAEVFESAVWSSVVYAMSRLAR